MGPVHLRRLTLFKPGPNLDVSTRNPTEPSLAKCLLFYWRFVGAQKGLRHKNSEFLQKNPHKWSLLLEISSQLLVTRYLFSVPFPALICPQETPNSTASSSPLYFSEKLLSSHEKCHLPIKSGSHQRLDLDRSGLSKQHLNSVGPCFFF